MGQKVAVSEGRRGRRGDDGPERATMHKIISPPNATTGRFCRRHGTGSIYSFFSFSRTEPCPVSRLGWRRQFLHLSARTWETQQRRGFAKCARYVSVYLLQSIRVCRKMSSPNRTFVARFGRFPFFAVVFCSSGGGGDTGGPQGGSRTAEGGRRIRRAIKGTRC